MDSSTNYVTSDGNCEHQVPLTGFIAKGVNILLDYISFFLFLEFNLTNFDNFVLAHDIKYKD